MPRYWVIAPVESKPPGIFDRVWEFDLANNVISIGWEKLGDFSKLTKEELAAKIAVTCPEKPPQTKSLITNMNWSFFHEIAPGDIILARRGRMILSAVGTVTSRATYSPGRSSVHTHSCFVEVKWHDTPRDKAFPTVVFPMHTLAEFTEDQYRAVVSDNLSELPISEEPPAVTDRTEFVLEKYLEEFIVSNFGAIFKGKLELYEDSEGNIGQQYTTEIGPIDILAYEPKTKTFVVLELKKGRPSDQVVGQVLRYMGWVKHNLCTEGQSVRGIVICRDKDPKLLYALGMVNNVEVKYFRVSFELRDTP